MTKRNILSIDELWSTVGGNSAFTFEALLNQLSESEICGDDGFLIHRQDETYFVPRASITDYFTTHPRPNKRMNREDERTALLKKISELEKLNAKLQQGEVKPEKVAPVFSPVSVFSETGPSTTPGNFSESETPLFENPTEPAQAIDEIKRDLERSLRGKQPIRSKKE